MTNNKIALWSICLALTVAGGCTDGASDTQEAFETQAHAIFGENDGSPWLVDATQDMQLLNSSGSEDDGFYGRTMAIGNMKGTGADVLFVGHGGMYDNSGEDSANATGFVDFFWIDGTGVSNTPYRLFSEDKTVDGLGRSLVVGDYCKNVGGTLRVGDIMIASAPRMIGDATSGSQSRAGGIVAWTWNKRWYKVSTLRGEGKNKRYGQAMSIVDINKDGKEDLVYTGRSAFGSSEVYVTFDICSSLAAKEGILRPDVTLTVNTQAYVDHAMLSNFGRTLDVVDLSGKGDYEIVIVDSGYSSDLTASTPTVDGAVYFYKYDKASNSLVQSRPTLTGETGSGLSVAKFKDIDGDGNLDIFVGEPHARGAVAPDVADGYKEGGHIRAYRNLGPGKAFDKSKPLFALGGPSRNRHFGADFVIDDVNMDGVDDLVVGAPGLAGSTSSNRSPGYVYAYLGTKDGSIFSEKPYWTHLATGENTTSSGLGWKLLTSQLDSSGWKDIIVGAPGQLDVKDTVRAGHVEVFYSRTSPCYTADKCLVNEVCYDAGQSPADNACLVCEPKMNNFGLQTVTCSGVMTNPCEIPATTCDPVTKCEATKPVPDGTQCGANKCDGNALSNSTCKAGKCVVDKQDCGNYVCSIVGSGYTCPTSCIRDSDCVKGLNCKLGKCSKNTAPVASISPTNVTAFAGDKVDFTAKVQDSDGDSVKVYWEMKDAKAPIVVLEGTAKGATLLVAADAAPGNYDVLMTADDGYVKTVVSAVVTVEPTPIPENHAPVAMISPAFIQAKQGDTVHVSAVGSYDEDNDPITYRWSIVSGNPGSFTASRAAESDFVISNDAVLGEYRIKLIVLDDKDAYDTKVIPLVIDKMDVPDVVLPSPVIVAPKDKSEVVAPVVISGTADDTLGKMVKVTEADRTLCTAYVNSGEWKCELAEDALSVGAHEILAYLIDADNRSSEPAKISIIVTEPAVDGKPTIESPKNGEVTSLQPYIEGTSPRGEGDIEVWYTKNGGVDQHLMCKAIADADGDWRCFSIIPLLEGDYTVRAIWQDAVTGEYSAYSDPVTFTAKDDASISFITPVDGNTLDASKGLIVSGIAEDSINDVEGNFVNVSLSKSDDEDIVVAKCATSVRSDGTWYCSMIRQSSQEGYHFLENGEYTLSATMISVATSNSYTTSVTITVANEDEVIDPVTDLKGGSCSTSLTQPANVSPWWFAIAAFGLMLVSRRRRD